MKTEKPKFIYRENLLKDTRILTTISEKSAKTLFDYLSLAAYSDKSYLRQAEKGTYLCPPYFCNVFIVIANYYDSDTYLRIRKILRNYSSASFQDVGALFLLIANFDTTILPSKQQERIRIVYGILMKLSYLEITKPTKSISLKNYKDENRTIKQELLSYVLDETQNTILSLDVKYMDQLVNMISISDTII